MSAESPAFVEGAGVLEVEAVFAPFSSVSYVKLGFPREIAGSLTPETEGVSSSWRKELPI